MSTRSVADQILNEGRFNGIFAGWGMSRVVAMNYSAPNNSHDPNAPAPLVIADTKDTYSMYDDEKPRLQKVAHPTVSLGSFFSIALAGCDLMSSALYTPGTVTIYSGKYTFVGLLLVTAMLSMFRKVYSEVVTAIPVNGGTYNLVLNTVNKKLAAFVACLSILSYIATSIISAYDSMVYLSELWPDVDLRLFTVLVMIFFGAVTICGVSESSYVNASIFVLHMFTLTLLILWGFAYGCQDGFSIFTENMHTPAPKIVTSEGDELAHKNAMAAIYFGYSAGLLGITGFETASNYVEELASTDVFVTTVNGLWLLVGIYNPLISLVSMMILPLDDIYSHPAELLAEMAKKLGGEKFSTFICVDAVIVLCGAVLTSIIGISGLLVRLSKDRILPDSFAMTNSRGAPYVSIISFVVISITLFLSIYDPGSERAINDFAGVYSIAFLSVLLCFAAGAILLKLYRPRIARLVIAQWYEIILSLLAVFIGFIGNIVLTPGVFYIFLIYLSGLIALAVYMFSRVEVLSFGIWMIRKIFMNQKKRKLEENDSDIIQACQIQDQYNERTELIKGDFNRKAIRKAVRKSILAYKKEKEQSEPTTTTVVHDSSNKEVSETGIELTSLPTKTETATATTTTTTTGAAPAPVHRESRFGWIPKRMMSTSSQLSVESIDNRDHKSHFSDYINIVQQRLSSVNLYSHIPNLRYYDRSAGSLNDLELILQRPMIGKYLKYLMKSLDELVSQPFCYLAKHSDPISLQLAINYINNNELSNNIYILHFVDDRKVINAFEEYNNEYHHYLHNINNDDHLEQGGIEGENGISTRKRRYSFQLPDNGMVLKLLMKSPNKKGGDKDKDNRTSLDGTELGSGDNMSDRMMEEEKSSEVSVMNQFTLESCVTTLPTETQQLLQNVAILDAFYAYKKIHAIVIRGGFFCPSCLDSVADYLNILKNNMIMGVPDSKFPFPFAKLNGCRIAIPDADPTIRQNTTAHLKLLLENPALFSQYQQQQEQQYSNRTNYHSYKNNSSGKSPHDVDEENEEDLNSEPPNDHEYENNNNNNDHDNHDRGDLHSRIQFSDTINVGKKLTLSLNDLSAMHLDV